MAVKKRKKVKYIQIKKKTNMNLKVMKSPKKSQRK